MKNNSVYLVLLVAQQEAHIACTTISSMLKENLRATNKDPVILPVYSATGRWVNTHWLSGNKVGRHGYKSYYESLKHITKYSGVLDTLAYVADSEAGTSKYKFFNEIVTFLYTDFVTLAGQHCKDVEIAASILRAGNRLKSEHERLLSLIALTISVMRGKDEAKAAAKAQPKKENLVGQQQVQIEQIVNMQLATLASCMPKDEVAALRTRIMRADNKLKALQEAMSTIELPF